MPKATVKLIDGMQFTGSADSGHEVIMDAPPAVGGRDTGPRPMELLLMGLGGCTGMDVISIMRKKQQVVTGFEINVFGEQAEDHPHKYTSLHIEYVITGKDISEDAVKRSIRLSLDKYCSVAATLEAGAGIEHSYRIVQE
jgi:putative redox protein